MYYHLHWILSRWIVGACRAENRVIRVKKDTLDIMEMKWLRSKWGGTDVDKVRSKEVRPRVGVTEQMSIGAFWKCWNDLTMRSVWVRSVALKRCTIRKWEVIMVGENFAWDGLLELARWRCEMSYLRDVNAVYTGREKQSNTIWSCCGMKI